MSIEEAASHLVSLILRDDGLLKYPEIENIFDYLSDADIPREVSLALLIGSWNRKTADRIKEQEWAQVAAAVQYAELVNMQSRVRLAKVANDFRIAIEPYWSEESAYKVPEIRPIMSAR